MIATIHKNKKNNKFLPMITIAENETKVKKVVKQQLMKEIIESPESLKAYKELEIYTIGKLNDNMEWIETKTKFLFSYEELLKEITDLIIKENKK